MMAAVRRRANQNAIENIRRVSLSRACFITLQTNSTKKTNSVRRRFRCMRVCTCECVTSSASDSSPEDAFRAAQARGRRRYPQRSIYRLPPRKSRGSEPSDRVHRVLRNSVTPYNPEHRFRVLIRKPRWQIAAARPLHNFHNS